MNMIRLICPNCGANLSVSGDGGREYCFCEYCGARIKLYDPNMKTYRYIDEARIREAELNAQLKEKELELSRYKNEEYEKRTAFNRNFFKKRIFIYLALAIVSGFFGYTYMDESIGIGMMMVCGIAMIALTYGSAGHAIALLVKRKRYK